MNENTAGFIHSCAQETATAGTYAEAVFFQPLQTIEPNVDDVGIVLNGRFHAVAPVQPTNGTPVMLIEVPKSVAPDSANECMRLETPYVINSYGQTGSNFGGRNLGQHGYGVLDTPLEADPDFDATDKNDPSYVANSGIATIHSLSEIDTDDIEYIWTCDDVEDVGDYYSVEGPHPEMLRWGEIYDSNARRYNITTQPANGTVWDGKPFLPRTGKYLHVMAYKYGRFLSEIRTVDLVRKIGKLVVTYDEDTAKVTVTTPHTGGCSCYVYKLGGLSNASPYVLPASGSYSVYATKTGMSVSDTFALGNIILKTEETIENGTYTKSFTKTYWSQLPAAMTAPTKATVAVALEMPKPDYYISPDGTGDGLTPETPANWARILGLVNTLNKFGSPEVLRNGSVADSDQTLAGKTIWATVGTYESDNATHEYLYVPESCTVIGGWSRDFTTRSGRSTADGGGIGNNSGTVKNFQAAPGKLNAFYYYSYGVYYFGTWTNCSVIGTYSDGAASTISGGSLIGCEIDVECTPYMVDSVPHCASIIIYADVIKACAIKGKAAGAIIGRMNCDIQDTSVDLMCGISGAFDASISSPFIYAKNCTFKLQTYNSGDGVDGVAGTSGVEHYRECWTYQDENGVEQTYCYEWDVPYANNGEMGSSGGGALIRLGYDTTSKAYSCDIEINMAASGSGGRGGSAAYQSEVGWSTPGAGGDGGTNLVSLSGQGYKCNLDVSVAPAGNGAACGSTGGGNYARAGFRGYNGVGIWTYWSDCNIAGTIGANGEDGVDSGGGVDMHSGAIGPSYWHPDGYDQETCSNGIYLSPTNGWYSGDGGDGSETTVLGYAASGGNGIPVPGFTTPGTGGVNPTGTDGVDGYYVGDYWELMV